MNEELKEEIEAMHAADQEMRRRAMEIAGAHGRSSAEYQEFRPQALEMDRRHIARLKAIIEEHGWPGESIVGPSAATGAFLILQHADAATQREYLPLVRDAAAEGELDRSLLPLLKDRLRLDEGKPQIYGTQITRNENGEPELWPIEDEASVDERRASMGLEPLDRYLSRFGIERGK